MEEEKEEKENDSSSFIDIDIIGGVLDIASSTVSKVTENLPSSTQTEEILGNISETISSAAGAIGEHAGDILDGASKVAEGVIDVIGDIAGSIEP